MEFVLFLFYLCITLELLLSLVVLLLVDLTVYDLQLRDLGLELGVDDDITVILSTTDLDGL
jgi:hypothetical protein